MKRIRCIRDVLPDFVTVIGYDGMVLQIRNISRYCDDIYQCVATNGVEPSASREMTVTVHCKSNPK